MHSLGVPQNKAHAAAFPALDGSVGFPGLQLLRPGCPRLFDYPHTWASSHFGSRRGHARQRLHLRLADQRVHLIA